jgi:hypothetical protein
VAGCEGCFEGLGGRRWRAGDDMAAVRSVGGMLPVRRALRWFEAFFRVHPRGFEKVGAVAGSRDALAYVSSVVQFTGRELAMGPILASCDRG